LENLLRVWNYPILTLRGGNGSRRAAGRKKSEGGKYGKSDGHPMI
jgi:hypothetical protein